jgi:hypothetical protein
MSDHYQDLIELNGRERSGKYVSAQPIKAPHEILVTGKPHSNGRVLRVRCLCMAQTNWIPSRRYYSYDWIAEVTSLQEAQKVFNQHVKQDAPNEMIVDILKTID